MLFRWLVVLVCALALLIGVQVPNYVTQYEQRVQAQLTEVERNLAGFEEIAKRYFDGDIQALLAYHRQSHDEVFRAEAEPLARMLARRDLLTTQWQELQVPYLQQLWFLVRSSDAQVREETFSHYAYTVPLTSQALYSGGVGLLLVLIVLEVTGAGCRATYRRLRRRSSSETPNVVDRDSSK